MSGVRQEEPVCGAAGTGGSSRGWRKSLPNLGVLGLPILGNQAGKFACGQELGAEASL
jgi:hypothetical protein